MTMKRHIQSAALTQNMFDYPARALNDPLLANLDFKPVETREGYTGMFFMYSGLLMVLFPIIFSFMLSAWTLAWYTFRDTTTRIYVWDDASAFKVRHGRDAVARMDPALRWSMPWGYFNAFDPKVMYHYEIEDALKRKAKLVEEGKFEFYM